MPSAFRGAEWCTAPIITISPRLALRAATSNDDASEPLCKDEMSVDDDPFDLLACAKLCAAHSMGLDECLIARGSVGSASLEAAIRRSHRRLVTSFGDRVQVLGTTPNGVSSRVYRRDLIRRILSAPVAPCAASVGATALRPPPSVAELQLGWARSSAASADGTQVKPPRLPFYLHEFEEGRRSAELRARYDGPGRGTGGRTLRGCALRPRPRMCCALLRCIASPASHWQHPRPAGAKNELGKFRADLHQAPSVPQTVCIQKIS